MMSMEEYKELNGIQKTIVTAIVFAVIGLIAAIVYLCFWMMFNVTVLGGFVCLCLVILGTSLIAIPFGFSTYL